jgi:hypothetical protein
MDRQARTSDSMLVNPFLFIKKGNTRLDFFYKKPMSPQVARRQLRGNPGIVSLRQFRDNEA